MLGDRLYSASEQYEGRGVAELLSERHESGVAILTLRETIDLAQCAALDLALADALHDDAVVGIVLAGGASGFDVMHSDLPALVLRFSELTHRMRHAAKAIVFVLSGTIKDEGLDLALSAQARVAASKTRVSLTRASLGLIPGGGATQLLPRMIGPEAALHLMLTGEAVPVADAHLRGLVHSVVEGDAAMVAIKLAQKHLPPEPKRHADPAAFQTAVANAGARLPKPTPAQADIIDCVEAAQLLALPQGLAFETARFLDRAKDPLSRLLRHSASVAMSARPHDRDLARPVTQVVVMGRSSETADLAAMALEQGHYVAIEAGSASMGTALEELTRKRLRPVFRQDDTLHARLTRDLTGADLEEADLIFDTAELTPDPPVTLKEGAVWIVTSPDFAAAARAVEVHATGRTLRMRRLLRASDIVELSAPPETGEDTIATAHVALSTGHQNVIVTADAPGGLLGALFCAVSRAALVMLAAGQRPGDIEQAARDIGLRQGPLQMIDVIGAGRTLAQMRRVYAHRGAAMAPLRLLSDRMADVSEGDETRARRALVFHAPTGQSFTRDPDLRDWLSEWRVDHADRAPAWPEIDLGEALLAAMVSEAARLLQDKVVKRASDIDLAAEKGLLMHARRGGPLIRADMTGLLPVLGILRRLNAMDSAVWAPEPLLTDMVKHGRRFF